MLCCKFMLSHACQCGSEPVQSTNGSHSLHKVSRGIVLAQPFIRLPAYPKAASASFSVYFLQGLSAYFAINIVGDPFVVDQLKTQFQRLRPSNIHNTYAFPSGHTTADVFIMGSTLACCKGTAASAHVCWMLCMSYTLRHCQLHAYGLHVAQLSPGIITCRLDSRDAYCLHCTAKYRLMQSACMLQSSLSLLACVIPVSRHSGLLMS